MIDELREYLGLQNLKTIVLVKGGIANIYLQYDGNFDDIVEKLDRKVNFNTNEYFGWNLMCKYFIIPEHYLRKYCHKLNFELISVYQILSEDFISTFRLFDFDWFSISRYQDLSEDFIEKFKHFLDWKVITRFQKKNLSWKFIEKHKNELSWDIISSVYKLTEKRIEKYKDRLNLRRIACYQKLTESFMIKYFDVLKVHFYELCKHQRISEEFIQKNADFMFYYTEDNIYKECWYYYCNNPLTVMSETFIEKFQFEVNWDAIAKNQKLSEEFVLKFKDKLDIYFLRTNRYLSKGFLDELEKNVK